MTPDEIFAPGFKTTPWWWEWAPLEPAAADPIPSNVDVAIIGGGYVDQTGLGDALTLSPETLTIALIVYGFVASVLPVWMLLTPRDYLSTFMKIGVIVLLAIMSRVSAFGDSREVSRPRAASARATSGWICSPGSVPADSATTWCPA